MVVLTFVANSLKDSVTSGSILHRISRVSCFCQTIGSRPWSWFRLMTSCVVCLTELLVLYQSYACSINHATLKTANFFKWSQNYMFPLAHIDSSRLCVYIVVPTLHDVLLCFSHVQVLVWHTQTKIPALPYEKKNPSNMEFWQHHTLLKFNIVLFIHY